MFVIRRWNWWRPRRLNWPNLLFLKLFCVLLTISNFSLAQNNTSRNNTSGSTEYYYYSDEAQVNRTNLRNGTISGDESYEYYLEEVVIRPRNISALLTSGSLANISNLEGPLFNKSLGDLVKSGSGSVLIGGVEIPPFIPMQEVSSPILVQENSVRHEADPNYANFQNPTGSAQSQFSAPFTPILPNGPSGLSSPVLPDNPAYFGQLGGYVDDSAAELLRPPPLPPIQPPLNNGKVVYEIQGVTPIAYGSPYVSTLAHHPQFPQTPVQPQIHQNTQPHTDLSLIDYPWATKNPIVQTKEFFTHLMTSFAGMSKVDAVVWVEKFINYVARLDITREHILGVAGFAAVYLILAVLLHRHEIAEFQCAAENQGKPIKYWKFHASRRFVPAKTVDPHLQRKFLDLFTGDDDDEDDLDFASLGLSGEDVINDDLDRIAELCPKESFFYSLNPRHIEAYSAIQRILVGPESPEQMVALAKYLLHSDKIHPKVWYVGMVGASMLRQDMTGFSLPHPLDAIPDWYIPADLISDLMRQYKKIRIKRSLTSLKPQPYRIVKLKKRNQAYIQNATESETSFSVYAVTPTLGPPASRYKWSANTTTTTIAPSRPPTTIPPPALDPEVVVRQKINLPLKKTTTIDQAKLSLKKSSPVYKVTLSPKKSNVTSPTKSIVAYQVTMSQKTSNTTDPIKLFSVKNNSTGSSPKNSNATDQIKLSPKTGNMTNQINLELKKSNVTVTVVATKKINVNVTYFNGTAQQTLKLTPTLSPTPTPKQNVTVGQGGEAPSLKNKNGTTGSGTSSLKTKNSTIAGNETLSPKTKNSIAAGNITLSHKSKTVTTTTTTKAPVLTIKKGGGNVKESKGDAGILIEYPVYIGHNNPQGEVLNDDYHRYKHSHGKGHKKKGKKKGKKKKKDECINVDWQVGIDNGVENELWYWREDLMLNQHHWYWHQTHPVNSTMHGDRRAELFYAMHREFVARYNAERLSNGLPRCGAMRFGYGKIIEEGYNSHLADVTSGMYWTPRWPETPLNSIIHEHDPDFAQNISMRGFLNSFGRLSRAIKTGKLYTDDGFLLPIDHFKGIEPLANAVEASDLSVNPMFYDPMGVHALGHIMIALAADPDFRFRKVTGIMSESAVSMRDPSFYSYHTFIDNFFELYKQRLAPYKPIGGDFPLLWKGVELVNIELHSQGPHTPVNELRTFWTRHEFQLSPGVDRSIKKGEKHAKVCAQHLDHEPFYFKIVIDRKPCVRSKSNKATVRIFMAPRYDEKGKRIPVNVQRRQMFSLDIFQVKLKVGRNTITRYAEDSSLTQPWTKSIEDFERGPDASGSADFCGCGFPQHLYIPKGHVAGLAFDLFVMVTNYDEDFVPNDPRDLEVPETCNSPYILCGLPRRRYPDRRPMGYPFDRPLFKSLNCPPGWTFFSLVCKTVNLIINRPIATLEEYVRMVPNMAMLKFHIKHLDDFFPEPARHRR